MLKNKGGIIYLIGLVIVIIIVVLLYFKFGGTSKVEEQVNDTNDITAFDAEREKELKEKSEIYFASISSLPKENIPSNKIALGKKLYFDTRLSKDGTISCNSCHNMNTYGVDNLALSPGDTEELGARNSPTVFYAHLHGMQFWDGRAKDVEEQAGGPILNPVEHNIPSEAFLEERLRGIEEYQAMFKEVYPDSVQPITFATISNAIGAFERQLAPVSRFDEWLDGDKTAMTTQEKEGLIAFIDNACITCHNGAALGGNMLQKFGLNGDYWEHTMSEVIDKGVYDLTKEERDLYMFKTPGLRNVEKTYPYFHDGSVDKLGDAVVADFYEGKTYAEANVAIEELIRNGVPKHASVPQSVKDLFEYTEKTPSWLDKDLLKLGAEACMKTGLDALISLRDYSLMGGYDYAYLNKPLVFTGALKKGALKRLSETLDFWINVSRYDAMEIHGKGYEYAIKTRLIHSYARLKLKKHYKDWDYETMGEPINWWDMTATSNGFSLVLLHGLKKLGNTFSKEEELGMFHLWKYISYLLGVPEEHLPNNAKEAVEDFYMWTSIQPPSDKDSVFLAQSLVQESLDNPILRYKYQRKFLNYIHISNSKFLLDPEVFERLELPKVWNANMIPKSLKFGNKVMQKFLSKSTLIARGNKAQMNVLKQYLEINTP